jgi:hypothetical protein
VHDSLIGRTTVSLGARQSHWVHDSLIGCTTVSLGAPHWVHDSLLTVSIGADAVYMSTVRLGITAVSMRSKSVSTGTPLYVFVSLGTYFSIKILAVSMERKAVSMGRKPVSMGRKAVSMGTLQFPMKILLFPRKSCHFLSNSGNNCVTQTLAHAHEDPTRSHLRWLRLFWTTLSTVVNLL